MSSAVAVSSDQVTVLPILWPSLAPDHYLTSGLRDSFAYTVWQLVDQYYLPNCWLRLISSVVVHIEPLVSTLMEPDLASKGFIATDGMATDHQFQSNAMSYFK